jgi:hypothetical protein
MRGNNHNREFLKMDIAALGFTKEELREQIIQRAADTLLNDDRDYQIDVESIIKERIGKAIQLVTEKVGNDIVVPKVEAMIEGLTFQKTNGYGEPKAPAQTWRELLIDRAEKWLVEPVSYEGKTKAENSYNWSLNTTRIAYLVDKHLQYEINREMAKALGAANSAICKGIADAVKIQLAQIVEKLRVEVKTK